MEREPRKRVNKTVILALLTAVSLCLYVVESQIPPVTPFPGIKIGLANIVTLFILHFQGFKGYDAVMVLFARILLSAFVTGSVFSLIFSLSGGVAAIAVMLLFRRVFKGGHIPVTGVAGGLAHNLGQTLAAVFVYSKSILFYLPVLVLGGVISGLITGFTATIILKFFKGMKGNSL